MTTMIEQALLLADETREVMIGKNIFSQTGNMFRRCFGAKRARIIADPTTFFVAGKHILREIQAEGMTFCEEPFLFDSADIHAEMKHVDTLRALIGSSEAIPIAVGSGTINDLTKYAAFLCNRPYMIIATAASMDGYTSFGASIEHQHCKQTFNCPAPAAVLVDMEVIAQAPREMNAAGYADLIAKIPAAADWILADLLGTEPIDQSAWNLVQRPLRTWLANPEGIALSDEKSLTCLIEGLIMSGLAMQKAKSSRTASGAEHQFSHLWDNLGHTYHGSAPSHGFKVGIGTVATSALYEKILATFTRKTFQKAIERLPSSWRSWSDIQREVKAAFVDPTIYETAINQCEQKFIDKEKTQRRLELFYESWPELEEQLRQQLLPASTVAKMLRISRAPSSPEEIGIDRPQLHRSFRMAQMLRYRYNVLDWMLELGLWHETVDALFEQDGFFRDDVKP